MKLIFAGTPEFAALALRRIVAAGHTVALVLTRPDKPSGRGMALRPSAVKEVAQAAGLPVFQPPTLRDAAVQERLREIGAEALVVAAYGLILPPTVLDLPRFGSLNIHASLLPRWRGAAPIQRAILAGDAETGVCIMQMDAGLDTGPVLRAERLPIASDDTAASLHDKLAELGARLIVETLVRLPLPASPQAEAGVNYAAKVEKTEAVLDWRLPAIQLERQIRAFDLFPGATASLAGNPFKIWRAGLAEAIGQPGEIVVAEKNHLVVACGEGALRLDEVQKAGGKRLPVAQFLVGHPLRPGSLFDRFG